MKKYEIIEKICAECNYNEEETLKKICSELGLSLAEAYRYTDKIFKSRWTKCDD